MLHSVTTPAVLPWVLSPSPQLPWCCHKIQPHNCGTTIIPSPCSSLVTWSASHMCYTPFGQSVTVCTPLHFTIFCICTCKVSERLIMRLHSSWRPTTPECALYAHLSFLPLWPSYTNCIVMMYLHTNTPCPPLDNIRVMGIVWRLRGNVIRTALCWIVWHNVHSQQHTYMSSSYRSNRLGLWHWDPYAVRTA